MLTDNTVFSYITITVIFSAAAWVIGYAFKKKFKEKSNKPVIIFSLTALLLICLLLYFFGPSVSAVRGIVFSIILLVSSYSDIRTREADNYLSVMILITALIGKEPSELPSMCLAAIAVGLSMIIGLLFTKGNTIGGADIKLSCASVFLLGMEKGFFGLILGLLLGTTVNTVINIKNRKNDGFPLVPYLSAGFIAAYFI